MKNLFWSILVIIGLVIFGLLSAAPSAFALSTEYGNTQGNANASQLVDPDEQKPNFMIGTTRAPSNNATLSMQNSVTPPTPGDYSYGAQAFDHAFEHQQNRE